MRVVMQTAGQGRAAPAPALYFSSQPGSLQAQDLPPSVTVPVRLTAAEQLDEMAAAISKRRHEINGRRTMLYLRHAGRQRTS